jgi:hypothetical protein
MRSLLTAMWLVLGAAVSGYAGVRAVTGAPAWAALALPAVAVTGWAVRRHWTA